MHNIGFLADIRYADILQLIWLIADTNIFPPIPNCTVDLVSSALELNCSIFLHTLRHIVLLANADRLEALYVCKSLWIKTEW